MRSCTVSTFNCKVERKIDAIGNFVNLFTFLLQNFFQLFKHITLLHRSQLNTHIQISEVHLFTNYCYKWCKVAWMKNNLSDFNKIAKQLMDDGKQKKHFSSKIQKVCSLPILAQNLPNSAQVLSWAYCLIISRLRSPIQLKESI